MSLDNIEIIKVKRANDTMGVKIDKNKIIFWVPSAFRIENNEEQVKEDLLKFILSLSISKAQESLYSPSCINNFNSSGWPVTSFLWIIKDYLDNGFYYDRTVVNVNDSFGKINWKKTIKKTPLFIGDNVIYDSFVISKMQSRENEITQIYKYCLKQSVMHIGWFFKCKIPVEVNLLKTPVEMISIVNKELNSTFDDNKKCRFNNMLAILSNSVSSDLLASNYHFTISNYYYVYEVMVDNFFCGIKGEIKSKFNPKGKWNFNGGASVESSSLRPDTIYIDDDNNTFVLDAKMYEFGMTGDISDLPNSSSIQKQVTYGDHIFNNVLDKKYSVKNAFILPFDKENQNYKSNVKFESVIDDNLVYFGYAEPKWREFQNEQYNYIYSFLIDFNYLLRNYSSSNSLYISELCKYINQEFQKMSAK